MADLVIVACRYCHARRQLCSQAAKAATTRPHRFGVGEDRSGLVWSPASLGRAQRDRHHSFFQEIAAKRLGLLHELVPKAVRVVVLVNPANVPTAEAALRDIPEAARAIGLQIKVLNASNSREIERPSRPSCANGPTHFCCY